MPPVAVAPADRPYSPLWLLVLITFSGTLAMHVFIPALPAAARDLNASIGSMQLSVSLYVLGLAIGQLIYGPISDRFGRRPTLMAGLGLYTVAGVAAALAPTAHLLIAARLFQALGGCAGLVLGRAIARDTGSPEDTARRLALMSLMISAGPGLAPIVGAALADSLGWRAILVALALLGVVNFLFAWRLLRETSQPPAGFDFARLRQQYLLLVRSPAFLGYAVGGSLATTASFGFIAAAPFIFVGELHRPVHEVGLYLALSVAGVAVGSALASRLVSRMPIDRMILRANTMAGAAAFTMLGLMLAGHLSVPAIMAPMVLYSMGTGLTASPTLSQAMSVNRHVIGSASGLYGAVQMLVGAISTALVALGDDPALTMAVVLCGASAASMIVLRLGVRAHRRAQATAAP